ncbi:MAG: nucleotide exchange factor GrpE [Candidatus Latescibacteria bacterium]|nr:nucleotide exchange factor GrpE [Candidatus Latescibacterota bacterium]
MANEDESNETMVDSDEEIVVEVDVADGEALGESVGEPVGGSDDPADTDDDEEIVEKAPELSELDAALLEAEKLRDQWMRTAAELENLRKRMVKERVEIRQWAAEDVIRDLLAPMDNLNRALAHTTESGETEDEGQSLKVGVEMIYQELSGMLQRRGVTVIDAQGEAFDPAKHQALVTAPSDDLPAGEIMQVIERGYLVADRVLRPARVVVSSGPAEDEPDEITDSDDTDN